MPDDISIHIDTTTGSGNLLLENSTEPMFLIARNFDPNGLLFEEPPYYIDPSYCSEKFPLKLGSTDDLNKHNIYELVEKGYFGYAFTFMHNGSESEGESSKRKVYLNVLHEVTGNNVMLYWWVPNYDSQKEGYQYHDSIRAYTVFEKGMSYESGKLTANGDIQKALTQFLTAANAYINAPAA